MHFRLCMGLSKLLSVVVVSQCNFFEPVSTQVVFFHNITLVLINRAGLIYQVVIKSVLELLVPLGLARLESAIRIFFRHILVSIISVE